MSNVDKSERLSFTQLLLALLALCVTSIIAAVIVASVVVDPLQHFLRWAAAFFLIALSIFGAAGYVIVSRFLGKSGIPADVHLEERDRSLPRIPLAVRLRQGDGDEQFRAVAETASDGIISADQNGNIIYWNKAAERIFGYSASEVGGQSLAFLMPARFRDAHRAGIKRIVSTGESHVIGKVIELAGLKKDGSEFPLELSLSTWTTTEGRGFTGIIRDITQRKQVERRMNAEHTVARLLAESPTLSEATPKILQAICESLDWEMGAFWSVDQEAGVIRCGEIWHSPSSNLARFAVVSKQTAFPHGTGLPGRVWASGEPIWIPDVLKDDNFPRLPVASKEGLHAAFGFPIRRLGSVLGVMEFFSHKIQHTDDNLLQMLSAIGSQIGQFMERKRAEERVKALKEYVQMILDSVPDPIVILNEDAQVQYINGASNKAFNLHEADLRGPTLFDLLQADDVTREQLETEMSHYVESPQETAVVSPGHPAEVSLLRDPLAPPAIIRDPHPRKEIKFGHRTYHYTCFPVAAQSDEGQLMGLVLRDTTEESSLQNQLIQAEKLAGIALLTSGLGHELNNPLYSVLGFGEAILDEPDPTVMKEHAKTIVEEAKRMGGIIKDLTGRSRIEAGDLRVEVDVNEQLDHALGLTGLEQSGAKIQVQKNYAAVSKIWANPLELRQVFVNVIDNAVRAMEGTGRLEVATYMDQDSLAVRIRDSGPGIPAGHVSKIFDPFFTTKKQGEGTGLGLTIAHRIITKHGGQIRVETEQPGGTTFTVMFPRAGNTT
ncbi:MAG: PAS domain S-box protein [Nitrospirae bacterium]|nr:MAG: PAS domain S-box protein [Nitrospirota bacterium]